MTTDVLRKILIYILGGLIPYFLVRKFWPEKDSELEDLLKDMELSKNSIDPLENLNNPRGGAWFPTFKEIIKEIHRDKAAKAALIGVTLTIVGVELSTKLKVLIKEASPALVAMPVAKGLLEGFGTLSAREAFTELRKVLTDPNLSIEEKMELSKHFINAILVAAGSVNRRKLIGTILCIIIYLVGRNTPLFGALVLYLRELLNSIGVEKGIVNYIVTVYREYNAPFPPELIDLMEKTGVTQ